MRNSTCAASAFVCGGLYTYVATVGVVDIRDDLESLKKKDITHYLCWSNIMQKYFKNLTDISAKLAKLLKVAPYSSIKC